MASKTSLVIVKVENIVEAAALAEEFLPSWANSTIFQARLSSTGREPATHFAACGCIRESEDERELISVPNAIIHTYDPVSDPTFPLEQFRLLGIRPIIPNREPLPPTFEIRK